MAEPLSIPLTHQRRIVLDVAGAVWRVAYYAPVDAVAASNLEQSARRGSETAREALRALTLTRSIGKGKTLTEALTQAMTRAGRPPPAAELEQISRYVLACEYAARAETPA